MRTAPLLGVCLVAGMALAPVGSQQAQAQTKDITVILPNPSAINGIPAA